MNPTNLIKMANQIGAFFEAMPDRQQAVRDVASHITRSWEPRQSSAPCPRRRRWLSWPGSAP